MKTLSLLCLLALALPRAVLSTTTSPDEARHLLSRTGFGISPMEWQQLQSRGYSDNVKRLLDRVRVEPQSLPPAWVNEPPPNFRKLRTLSKEQKKAFRKRMREQAQNLKAWWYAEMLSTDSPLTEHMTLFWHNHFTSSTRKVRWPILLYRQNLLLRRHAIGSFRELLHAIARDPAMVLYLDNQTNRKSQPNENFARELLELFTLGEGHYTEADIKAAARAFTGWKVNRKTAAVVMRRRQHDGGVKVFLGKRGHFSGDDIIEILLQQPQLALHITEKLWREFISDTPDKRELARLARIFRNNDYRIRPLLYALLTSAAFRDPRNYGTAIKSPVELIVGSIRTLQIPMQDQQKLVKAGRALGQDIFDPPNVKGWPGGTYWIDSNTLLLRQEFSRRLLRAMKKHTPAEMLQPLTGKTRQALIQQLLPVAPVNELPDNDDRYSLLQALLLDPAYQLK